MADYEYTEDASETNFENPANTNLEQTEEPAGEVGTGESNGQAEGGQGEKINASKNEDDERKIFVGGLSWETNVRDLREYFAKFGEVADCTLKTDPTTGRSRGFGFVLFGDSTHVDKVIAQKDHSLHGRTIDPKRANPRGNKEPIKKIFVGGLDPETPEDDVRTYFGQYGKIEEIDLPYDKFKGQRRAFCFITFESEAVVDKCCEKQKHTITPGGKEVDVKKATPKDQQGGPGGRGRGWFGAPPRGRGTRGRGGYGQGWGSDYYGDYYGQGNYGSYGGDYYNQGYGGYDYNNYYNNQGWGNYNQGYGSGYGNGGYGNSGYGGKKRYVQKRNGNSWTNHE